MSSSLQRRAASLECHIYDAGLSAVIGSLESAYRRVLAHWRRLPALLHSLLYYVYFIKAMQLLVLELFMLPIIS